MKNLSLLFLILILGTLKNYAQEEPNPIPVAAPFLLIAPDARAGSMGDIGGATSTDANALHYNAAKFAFSESQYQIAVNYTPWLRNLTDDLFLGNIAFSNRINERSSWAASVNYFSLGTIDLTDEIGTVTGSENPYELSIDGAYSLKLSENFAMGVVLRYIRSDFSLHIEDSEIQAINSFAVDLSGFYQSAELNFGEFNGIWRAGFNLSNMGPTVELIPGNPESFIPANLKLSGGFEFILDDVNTITANLELNKLMVPSPPVYYKAGEIKPDGSVSVGGREPENIKDGKDPDVGFLQGMVQSFYDAPDGFSEELNEVAWALGTEYMYDNTFALRAGYFHEHDMKGGRQFFSIGAGFKFRSSTLDLSYLINASDVNSPLESTLRFSLSFNLGELYEYY